MCPKEGEHNPNLSCARKSGANWKRAVLTVPLKLSLLFLHHAREKREKAQEDRTSSMSSDAKATEYMAQGEKTLKKMSFFSFGGGSQKFEDASDLFEKAGNQFKISRKCALLC